MTREEAIKQLKDDRVLCINSETEPFAIAYDMAIQALEQEPILDKVREKIEDIAKDYDKFADYRRVRGLWIALEIIDKYISRK